MLLFNIIKKALGMESYIENNYYSNKKYKYDNYDNYVSYDNYDYDYNDILNSKQIKINKSVSFDLNSTILESEYLNESLDTNILKRKYPKIKLNYISSGSNGVILYDKENPDYIYKISILYDGYDLNGINLLDSIYSNYFKINYPEESKMDYFPVQNISTEIITLKEFLNYYLIDTTTNNKFKFVGITEDSDYIIINKMLNYDKNLNDYIKNNSNNIWNDFELIVKQVLKSIHLFHQDNLLHGDLKTTNIVFDGVFCKLIDFGGIKSSNINYYSKSCTISTRPPEDLDWEFINLDCDDLTINNKYVSSGLKGDIWSIGLVLYELITKFNGINDYYSKLFNIINETNIDKKVLKIENKINSIIKQHKQINFSMYIKKNNIIQEDKLKKLNQIERMLYINPDERIGDISSIYQELFNESLGNIKKNEPRKGILTNFKKRRIFNNYRKIVYPRLVEFVKKNNYMGGLEMTIDIMDRYLCKKINQDDSKIINMVVNKKINTNSNVLLISSALFISISIIYRKCWDLKSFIQTLNKFKFSQIEFTKSDINIIIVNFIKILNTLGFDIINVKIDYQLDNEQIENKVNKLIEFYY